MEIISYFITCIHVCVNLNILYGYLCLDIQLSYDWTMHVQWYLLLCVLYLTRKHLVVTVFVYMTISLTLTPDMIFCLYFLLHFWSILTTTFNNKVGRGYCSIVYVVHFLTPIFGSLYAQYLLDITISLLFYSYLSLYHLPPCVAAREVRKWDGGLGGWGGVGGLHGWRRSVRTFAWKIILACYLMCKPEAWCLFPLWISVPHETGESIFTASLWVQSCDRDCDLNVYPDPHVQNGFVHFWCHESTQICKYSQGLPP